MLYHFWLYFVILLLYLKKLGISKKGITKELKYNEKNGSKKKKKKLMACSFNLARWNRLACWLLGLLLCLVCAWSPWFAWFACLSFIIGLKFPVFNVLALMWLRLGLIHSAFTLAGLTCLVFVICRACLHSLGYLVCLGCSGCVLHFTGSLRQWLQLLGLLAALCLLASLLTTWLPCSHLLNHFGWLLP